MKLPSSFSHSHSSSGLNSRKGFSFNIKGIIAGTTVSKH